MSEYGFGKKVLSGLSREKGLGNMLRKASRLLRETAAAHVKLRGCDKVGSGARVVGRLRVENRGRIEIGDGLSVHASFCAVELVSEKGGAIEIGESVVLNFGTMLYARQLVRIGGGTQVGQYSILTDCEVPEAEGAFQEEPKPIVIGKDVWIAGRVTVLPGSTIGDGSVITAGSIVSGEIPPGVVAGGVPARVLRRVDGLSSPAEAPAKEEMPANSLSPAPADPAAAANVEPALRGLLLAGHTVTQLAHELGKGDESLRIEVHGEPLRASNLARFAQLINNTNQLNLPTRRLSAAELLDWSKGAGRQVWTLTVSGNQAPSLVRIELAE